MVVGLLRRVLGGRRGEGGSQVSVGEGKEVGRTPRVYVPTRFDVPKGWGSRPYGWIMHRASNHGRVRSLPRFARRVIPFPQLGGLMGQHRGHPEEAARFHRRNTAAPASDAPRKGWSKPVLKL